MSTLSIPGLFRLLNRFQCIYTYYFEPKVESVGRRSKVRELRIWSKEEFVGINRKQKDDDDDCNY